MGAKSKFARCLAYVYTETRLKPLSAQIYQTDKAYRYAANVSRQLGEIVERLFRQRIQYRIL